MRRQRATTQTATQQALHFDACDVAALEALSDWILGRLGLAADQHRICHLVAAPWWCKVVHAKPGDMMATTAKGATKLTGEPKMPRASVSFPPELYAMLERIAKEKKVSVAWVVREAAEKYVGDQWPLFAAKGQGG